jgi:hypothetical protein
MWYRMEGNTRKCTCGGVAEQWLVLGRTKPIVQTYICPTCHPELADYVSRQPSIARQSKNVGGVNEVVT